jgi:hypothetical protein
MIVVVAYVVSWEVGGSSNQWKPPTLHLGLHRYLIFDIRRPNSTLRAAIF